MRLITVSNRLPITLEIKDGKILFRENIVGLASGISSYLRSLPGNIESLWVGWPGRKIANIFSVQSLQRELGREYQVSPMFFSPADIEDFYDGFCNSTLWPLLHSFTEYLRIDDNYWQAYQRVNQQFADRIAAKIRPDDVIWIHDFHLMLLPKLLRDKGIKAPIGFFLHVPFPPAETFALLPAEWQRRIIESLSSADLVGFHLGEYARNFEKAAGLHQNKKINIGVFPISVDYDRFHKAFENNDVRQNVEFFKMLFPAHTKKILSIDRLDYIKGMKERLCAYQAFLSGNSQWHGKVNLIYYLVPSREVLPESSKLKSEIETMVSAINEKFGQKSWQPVIYSYFAPTFEQLIGLYQIADVALVTPLIDGMNLIAKEYVAAKRGAGVLILGAGAGAAQEMSEALTVNPSDTDHFADAINIALRMGPAEQQKRLNDMQNQIKSHDMMRWANNFISSLLASKFKYIIPKTDLIKSQGIFTKDA